MSDTNELRAVKLTKAQSKALQIMADVDGKSGRYYRELGASLTALTNLELRGLVRGEGAWMPIRAQWYLTPAGRALLAQENDHA